MVKHESKDYTIVSNNTGNGEFGIGLLLKENKVKRLIASYVGENLSLQKQFLAGDLELTPQVSINYFILLALINK